MKPSITMLQGENILFETQPQKISVFYTAITQVIRIFAVLFIIIVYFQMNPKYGLTFFDEYFRWNLITLLGILAFVFLISYVWCIYIYKRHWYILTNQRCILYSGVLGINKKIYNYNRLVDVDLRQSLLQSVFGLGSVSFSDQSMGGSIPETIKGLTYDQAEKVSHIISEHINKR